MPLDLPLQMRAAVLGIKMCGIDSTEGSFHTRHTPLQGKFPDAQDVPNVSVSVLHVRVDRHWAFDLAFSDFRSFRFPITVTGRRFTAVLAVTSQLGL
jgi:hypothetical protein